ncbi:LacI family DNA-binding transcriptional regulator [Streptomyces xylophagus]|uniref:LacI family DNA-binding transcriptional regulator n=1 Tax=Streptomyces xylophagus TaxID=285514 RepID=UPI0005BD243D|nr:LacI family DNA-binding transcriptional regulator [Streptomyces xylophagus]
MVTSRDVARLAGVSQSTVSYVMSGRRSISPETRRRVEEAIETLGFQPNAGARALASQRSQVIGLVVPFAPGADMTGVLPFIETITKCAREEDHNVILATEDEGAEGLTRLSDQSLCDAIVLMEVGSKDPRIPVAAGLSVPVILIGVPDDPAGLYCVDLDYTLAGRMAVDELAASAHDRVVLLGYPRDVLARDVNFVRRFLRGAEESAAAHDIAYAEVSPPDTSRAGAEVALDEALAGRGPGGCRLGLVVPDPQLIQPTLQSLLDRGLVPGRDLSVIGLCTDRTAETSTPPVTNLSLEPRDVSRRAMRILFRLLNRESVPTPSTVELVTPRLTLRQTSLPAH